MDQFTITELLYCLIQDLQDELDKTDLYELEQADIMLGNLQDALNHGRDILEYKPKLQELAEYLYAIGCKQLSEDTKEFIGKL